MIGILKAVCLALPCEVIAAVVVVEEYTEASPHTVLYWFALWLGLTFVLTLCGLFIWFLWVFPAARDGNNRRG